MYALVTPVLHIKKAEGLITSLGCLRKDRKPIFLEKKVYFPIIDGCISKLKEYLDRIDGTIKEFNLFPAKRRSFKSLRELEKIYGFTMPKSIDIIGDIATVNELPSNSLPLAEEIGEILRKEYSVRAVFLKVGETSGATRVAKWKRIAGMGETFTIHRENNLYFACDISKAFFNPRLGNERYRVISQVKKEKEIVVDLFAGVGPFSIPIAKKCAQVYAFDINCEAIELLNMNIQINSVPIQKISPMCEDAKRASTIIKNPVDRIIMNYPEGSLSFLDTALNLLRDRGMIHLYAFAREKEPSVALKTVLKRVEKSVSEKGFKFNVIFSRVNKEVAPRKYLVVLDLNVLKIN